MEAALIAMCLAYLLKEFCFSSTRQSMATHWRNFLKNDFFDLPPIPIK